ncbi:MAG: hypothetical protein WCL16_12770, partial [bacterium]
SFRCEKGGKDRRWQHGVFACISMIVILVVGLVVRWRWIRGTAIDPNLGDMLPLIQESARALLAGEFPYRIYHFPWPVPLTFPPALWMAYIPAEAVGLDLRYVALLCVAIMGAMWLMQYNALSASDRNAHAVCLWAWVGLVGAFFLSPLIQRFIIQGHTAPYWLALTLMPLLLYSRRNRAAAVCLGVICAMRQPAIFFVPILWWYWMRIGSWRVATLRVGTATVTAALIYLPFVVRDAEAVWWTPLQHYAELGRGTLNSNPAAILETIGFSNLFYLKGWDRVLSLLATLAAAVIVALHLRRLNTAAATVLAMALTSLGFTLLAPIPWYYEYFPVLILFMQAWWIEAMGPDTPASSVTATRQTIARAR